MKRTFHGSSCCCYETGRLLAWLFYFYLEMLSAVLCALRIQAHVVKTQSQLYSSRILTLDSWQPVSPEVLLAPSVPWSHTHHGLKNALAHRMVEVWRDVWRSSCPTHLLKQGHLLPVAQNHVQSSFEYLQRWRLHHLFGKPLPIGFPNSPSQ